MTGCCGSGNTIGTTGDTVRPSNSCSIKWRRMRVMPGTTVMTWNAHLWARDPKDTDGTDDRRQATGDRRQASRDWQTGDPRNRGVGGMWHQPASPPTQCMVPAARDHRGIYLMTIGHYAVSLYPSKPTMLKCYHFIIFTPGNLDKPAHKQVHTLPTYTTYTTEQGEKSPTSARYCM
jgi:hypothetical protein